MSDGYFKAKLLYTSGVFLLFDRRYIALVADTVLNSYLT